MKPFIKVIGAGISGLSCGLLLQEAGFDVQIIAAEKPAETTSAAAAGLWMPFHAGDHPRTGVWAKSTYEHCRVMQAEQNSGIFFIEHQSYFLSSFLEIEKSIQEADGFRIFRGGELKYGAQAGFLLRVPVMPSHIFLPFLASRFQALGGNFLWRGVKDLSDEAKNADLLINCTGFGARKLCGDQKVEAAKGHVVVVANPGLRENIVVTEENNFTHIYPVGDRCVLGGIYEIGHTDLTPDPRITEKILQRAAVLDPQLKDMPVLDVRTGLRPLRPAVRLDMEKLSGGQPVIHNYGHGGAGYTLAHGCAEDVLVLASGYLS